MRIAVITGASSGMGREFVKQIDAAETFDEIWVIARRKERLEELAAECKNKIRPLSLDLMKQESFDEYKTLLEAELICVSEKIVRSDLFEGREAVRTQPLTPNADQQKAVDLVKKLLDDREEKKRTILLWGVTNSGKTEVYLQSIAQALERGYDSIVLVPEISLTPQTVRRFRSRFGNDISVLHSQLSDRERFDEWMRIRNGEVKIVVGARSALFAPFQNLGLIIVDEEHEASYKQGEAPRYHARDVAVMRGYMENAVVILGSATPSAEVSPFARPADLPVIFLTRSGISVTCSPVISRTENAAATT